MVTAESPQISDTSNVADDLLSQIAVDEIDKLMVELPREEAAAPILDRQVETTVETVVEATVEAAVQSPNGRAVEPAVELAGVHPEPDHVGVTLPPVVDASLDHAANASASAELASEMVQDAAASDDSDGLTNATFEEPSATHSTIADLAAGADHAAGAHATGAHSTKSAGRVTADKLAAGPNIVARAALGILSILAMPLSHSPRLRGLVGGIAVVTLFNAVGVFGYVLLLKK